MPHLYFLALVCTIWWKRSVSLLLNSFPQVAQLKGLSSECTAMWQRSCTEVLQVLSQSWHLSICFHFSWRSRWFSRDRCTRKVFPHWSQAKGLGGLAFWWRLRWFWSDCSLRKDLLQRGQGKGSGALPDSCRSRWPSRDARSRKLRPQRSQGKAFLWVFTCFFSSPFQWKPESQCSQKNLFPVWDSRLRRSKPLTGAESGGGASWGEDSGEAAGWRTNAGVSGTPGEGAASEPAANETDTEGGGEQGTASQLPAGGPGGVRVGALSSGGRTGSSAEAAPGS
ncbi:unnamed protein product [Menidia menidia]|uniref:(Atlantic silverside) hypothetical protein n=1 Tax=Menidia menidia TaxID=238744 RepID=A0A8S4BLM2_9TELE|nr:unnamed protein product [Menidia menidia]